MDGMKRGIDSYPTYGHQTLLAKLLERHGGEVREAALRPLYEAINRAVKSDGSFSRIQWCTQKHFDNDHGNIWGGGSLTHH